MSEVTAQVVTITQEQYVKSVLKPTLRVWEMVITNPASTLLFDWLAIVFHTAAVDLWIESYVETLEQNLVTSDIVKILRERDI